MAPLLRYAAERDLAGAIAELREIAGGRDDILAETAGIEAGAWYAWPSTHAGYELVAAGMLIMASGHNGKPLDYDELERWTRVGYERGMRSRRGERCFAPGSLHMERRNSEDQRCEHQSERHCGQRPGRARLRPIRSLRPRGSRRRSRIVRPLRRDGSPPGTSAARAQDQNASFAGALHDRRRVRGPVRHLPHEDVRVDRRRVDDIGLALSRPRGDGAGAGVVLGEALDVVVERPEAGRGEDTDLAHRPARHTAVADERRDSVARGGHDGSAGRAEALRERDHRDVEPSGELRHAAPGDDRRVPESGVEVRRDPQLTGGVRDGLRVGLGTTTPPARL